MSTFLASRNYIPYSSVDFVPYWTKLFKRSRKKQIFGSFRLIYCLNDLTLKFPRIKMLRIRSRTSEGVILNVSRAQLNVESVLFLERYWIQARRWNPSTITTLLLALNIYKSFSLSRVPISYGYLSKISNWKCKKPKHWDLNVWEKILIHQVWAFLYFQLEIFLTENSLKHRFTKLFFPWDLLPSESSISWYICCTEPTGSWTTNINQKFHRFEIVCQNYFKFMVFV